MSMEKRTKGGQGGGKGHSNMTHWSGTEIIKKAHKKHLRKEAKKQINEVDWKWNSFRSLLIEKKKK